MSNTNTLAQQRYRGRNTAQVPSELWKSVRLVSLNLGITATQFVIDALNDRLKKADKLIRKAS